MAKKLTKFTQADIEKLPLPPRGKKSYYYDADDKNLELIVTSTGTKTFYFYKWVVDPNTRVGKPVRTKLGRYTKKGMQSIEFERNKLCVIGNDAELTIAQARAVVDAVKGQYAIGNNLQRQQQEFRAEPSFRELFDEYVSRHLVKQRKTAVETSKCFDRWFDAEWQQRKASTITQLDVEKLHSEIGLTKGMYAANRALQLLSAVFNKAIVWKLFVGENPARGVSKFTEHPRERVLEANELENFFSALEECEPDFQDFVRISLFTGQRKRNVLSMRHSDIDIIAETWTISARDMKNSRSLTVALSEIELAILKRRRNNNSEFVFPGRGKTGHYVEPKRAWTTLRNKAGVGDLHLHDLRRTLGNYMANSGANVALIQGALNHKDLKTTMLVYAQTANKSQKDAREKALDLMHTLGKRKPSNVVALPVNS